VKPTATRAASVITGLSVSSNGSTWVKLAGISLMLDFWQTFSILERIDVGETMPD